MPPPQQNPNRPPAATAPNADRQPPATPEAAQEPAAAPQGDPKAQDGKSTVPSPQTPPAAPQEPGKRFDETVPGGQYMVNGRMVDADGKPIAKK